MSFSKFFVNRPRFAAVLQLLSITNNWRLRLRVFAPDDDLPILASMVEVCTGSPARSGIWIGLVALMLTALGVPSALISYPCR